MTYYDHSADDLSQHPIGNANSTHNFCTHDPKLVPTVFPTLEPTMLEPTPNTWQPIKEAERSR